jgi:6-phosphogluconolactonase (cycloisomerase 2 family)
MSFTRYFPALQESPRTYANLLRQFAAGLIFIFIMLGLAAPSSVFAKKLRTETVYVQANDPTPGRNAVLTYQHDSEGCLQLVGTFPTGGTGALNPTDRLGTDDHDQEIIVSPDNKFLFTVNQGSNTIAVFKIKPDGGLTSVKGSPFPSGGNGPVSLGLSGDRLYVVNQNENSPAPSTTGNPNYTVFQVDPNGRLTPIPNSTIDLQRGDTPTQALISPDGRHVFGNQFFDVDQAYTPQLAPFLPARSSSLDSFNIQPDGRLVRAAGTPQPLPIEAMFAIPPARYSLGLQVHPTERILYVGFILGFKFAVYTYDAAGRLTFVTAAPLSDGGICWIVINKDRTRAYASNAITNTISVLDITNPLAPFQIQSVFLRLEADAPPGPFGPVNFATTPFQLALDPDSETLYVKNHETTPGGYAKGNALHILDVQPDGTLVENDCSPAFLPIPANAHAAGVVVLNNKSRR